MPDAVTYRVVHETRYTYANTVTSARQLAHLRPRTTQWQTVHAHHVEVDPAPSEQSEGRDYFGNGVMRFAVDTPHDELTVRAESIVEVKSHVPDTDAGPGWESALADPAFGELTANSMSCNSGSRRRWFRCCRNQSNMRERVFLRAARYPPPCSI